MLYYCFTDGLWNGDTSDDAWLAWKYAQALHCALFLNIETERITDADGNAFSVSGQHVFLRTTSDQQFSAIAAIQRNGGKTIEAMEDIRQIKHWFSFVPPQRGICSVASCDELIRKLRNGCIPWIQRSNEVFLKTTRKGFSQVVSMEELTKASFWSRLFDSKKIAPTDELVLSSAVAIRRDSLGTREWRIMVLNQKRMNESRYIHTLAHRIPSEIKEKADRIIQQFGATKRFPENYALDLMELDDGKIDIVEVNPISSAMCYVNNSIFEKELEIIRDIYAEFGVGYEFCYDALVNRERYHKKPYSSFDYTYYRD